MSIDDKQEEADRIEAEQEADKTQKSSAKTDTTCER